MKLQCLRSLVSSLACAAVCLLAAGCGSPMVKITGKIVRNGVPLPPDRKLEVTFFLVQEGPESVVPTQVASHNIFRANYQPDGTFRVPGKQRKGIPPGKYRINVGGAGRSKDQPPIIRELTQDEELIIDVAKPEG